MWSKSCPEGDHAANGLAEVAVREVKAQVRVLKSHLEERLGRRLEWTEPLASWIVRHAANCLSRCRVQADGRTPDQRRTGKKWRRLAVEFGKSVTVHPVAARGERRAAGDAERMLEGIFVGHHERTGATLFLTSKGVLRGTRIQRRAEGQWDSAFIASCRCKPWNMKGEEPAAEEPALPAAAPQAVVVAGGIAPPRPQERRRYILKQDVARYSATEGCTACADIRSGKSRVSVQHSNECRARMEELMQRDEEAVVQERQTEAGFSDRSGATGSRWGRWRRHRLGWNRQEYKKVAVAVVSDQRPNCQGRGGPPTRPPQGRPPARPPEGRPRQERQPYCHTNATSHLPPQLSSGVGGDVAAEQGTKFPRQLSQEGEAGAETAQRAAPKRKTEKPRGTKMNKNIT